MEQHNDLRLIEAGFPCHQVGAETQREQSVGLQPPVNRLHVWWARRPLTPSRAAIVASLDPAGTDPDTFIRQLGIERVQALVYGEPWTITDKLLNRSRVQDGSEVLPVDAVVLRALRAEEETRRVNRDLVEQIASENPDLGSDPALRRWRDESKPFPALPEEGDALPIVRIVGDPAWANEKLAFAAAQDIRFPGDPYGYKRAFANITPYLGCSI